MNMRAKAVLAVIMVAASIWTAAVVSRTANGVGGAAVTIQLDQTEQTVNVEPGSSGVLLFTGNVSAQVPWSPRIQYLLVNLNYEANDWATSGTSVVIFTREDTLMPFTCTVKVPPMTSHHEVGTLIVSGTWAYQPGIGSGEVNPVQAVIIIEQFFSHYLSYGSEYLEMEKEDVSNLSVNVHNQGNGRDRIAIEIANEAELSRYGIYTEIPENVTSVREGGTSVAEIMVETRFARIGGYQIMIHSWSHAAELKQAEPRHYNLSVEIRIVDQRSPQEDPPIDDEDPPEEEEEMPELDPDPQKDYEPYVPGEGGSFGPVLIVAVVIAALIVIATPLTIAIVVFRKRR